MLRKMGERKLVEYGSHLYTSVLNDMWVEWVSGMWDLFTIYGNYEPGLPFVDGWSICHFCWIKINFNKILEFITIHCLQ